MKSVAVLDNLRSVYNVGSIFRTVNAAGVDSIVLCGTTPTPLDTKGLKRSDFAKVALGAEETVTWSYEEETKVAIQKLQDEGYYIIAIEQSSASIDYKKVAVADKEKVAFLIGGEVIGIPEDILSMCDTVAEIPMLGTKESLNVTIAFGIAIYRILDI